MKKKVLIVEDEQEVVEQIERLLSKVEECEVSVAYDGAQALKELKSNDYNLVLLDIKMPGMSGIEVMRKFKEIKKLPKIIVITGHDDQQVLSQVMEIGVCDYMVKPIDYVYFSQKVKAILSNRDF